LIFAIGYFFKTAPWEWDNLKLMVWGYFLILPFLWNDILGRWAFPERAALCIALFGSGFVTLLAGLSAGHPGFGLIERARLDAGAACGRSSPFAASPDLQLSVLLAGAKLWRIQTSLDGRIYFTGVNNRLKL
jgi:hypothetical protein